MDWTQLLSSWGPFIGSTITILSAVWIMRKEDKEDRKEDKEDRKEMKALITKIGDEMRDFHGRLCSLEEKYHQIMIRLWEKK